MKERLCVLRVRLPECRGVRTAVGGGLIVELSVGVEGPEIGSGVGQVVLGDAREGRLGEPLGASRGVRREMAIGRRDAPVGASPLKHMQQKLAAGTL